MTRISTHSPHARRTIALPCSTVSDRKFQLTRPTRGEPEARRAFSAPTSISTHSPHARRTRLRVRLRRAALYFNSLAPREANRKKHVISVAELQFQLTRPTRGEPYGKLPIIAPPPDFNSLAPREANPSATSCPSAPAAFQLTRPTRGEPPYLAIGLLAHHYLGRTFTFRLILSSVFFRFFPRTSRDFRVVCGSHDQNMIKPSLSYPAFAPICSTFFFQSFPR